VRDNGAASLRGMAIGDVTKANWMAPLFSRVLQPMIRSSTSWRALVFALLTGGLLLNACDTADLSSLRDESIIELMQGVQEMRTFAAVVGADSTLSASLAEDGTYTVLVPRTVALSTLQTDTLINDPQILARVVDRHIIQGTVLRSGDITDGMSVTPIEGTPLTFSTEDGLRVNGARIVTTDVTASNGVLHILDRPILDRLNAAERILIESDLQVLETSFDLSDGPLQSRLQDDDATQTVFAPTNDAFAAAVDSSGDGSVSEAELGQVDLDRVLPYHVLPSRVLAQQIPTSSTPYETLLGSDLLAVRNGENGSVSVGSGADRPTAAVTQANLEARNGVIHVIDSLLVPPVNGSRVRP